MTSLFAWNTKKCLAHPKLACACILSAQPVSFDQIFCVSWFLLLLCIYHADLGTAVSAWIVRCCGSVLQSLYWLAVSTMVSFVYRLLTVGCCARFCCCAF